MSLSCSHPACRNRPVATLDYDYAARVATLHELRAPHPMQYDLCASHADRVSVPKGWTLVDGRVATQGTGVVPPLAS